MCPSWGEIQETNGFESIGALSSYTNFTQGSCQADGSGNEAHVIYVAPAAGELTVRSYSAAGNLDLYLRSDCDDPSSELGCSAATIYNIEEVVVDVDADEEVFIFVSGATAANQDVVYLEVVLE
jgi:hypothetical protein